MRLAPWTVRAPVVKISIHAPTWGATIAGRIRQEVFGISIHAPTWGATLAAAEERIASLFQSTHPRGVRQSDHDSDGSDDSISIHAPTWGATKSEDVVKVNVIFQSTHPRGVRLDAYCDPNVDLQFQSTHPRGVRLVTMLVCLIGQLFQSTHPRGVRPKLSATDMVADGNFNPRTHVGCDESAKTRLP